MNISQLKLRSEKFDDNDNDDDDNDDYDDDDDDDNNNNNNKILIEPQWTEKYSLAYIECLFENLHFYKNIYYFLSYLR